MSFKTLTLLTLAALFFPCPLLSRELDGETVLKAYRHTFPEKILSVSHNGEDWIVTGKEKSFAWAHGRLMPLEQKDNYSAYRPFLFEIYPAKVPDPKDYSPEEIEKIKRLVTEEESYTDLRYNDDFRFLLYGGPTRADLEKLLKRVSFLGHNVTVHGSIVEALLRIGRRVAAESAGDAELRDFLRSVSSIGGYNWREIRGTIHRSYHSWGLALDIQPRRQEKRAIYWQWEKRRNPAWMFIPPEKRWQPPEALIRAFESEGFVWGGKWNFFDTMHFEYRPELHEINRLLAAEAGDTRIAAAARIKDIHHIVPQLGARKPGRFRLY